MANLVKMLSEAAFVLSSHRAKTATSGLMNKLQQVRPVFINPDEVFTITVLAHIERGCRLWHILPV